MKEKKSKQEMITLGLRVSLESRERLDQLADVLGKQLGDKVTRVQAFNVAVKEALQKRLKDSKNK